jgi:hypothetical protein
VNIRQLARQANRDNADPVEAVKAFLAAATPAFRAKHSDAAWGLLAGYVVAEERHVERSNIKMAAARCERGEGAWDAIRAIGHETQARLAVLDSWRVGDKLLGDCTKADLLAAAAQEEAEAAGHEVNARFYRRLASVRGVASKPLRAVIQDAAVRAILAKEQVQ